jgi:AdoMet-dependent heme synthase
MQTGAVAHPRPPMEAMDFSRQPFILAWELTRACNLACVHCRAEAQLRRHPHELSSDEALAVIDQVASFDVPPIIVFTGGDPMRRPDLVQLIRHASGQGIRCTLTPAGTPLASRRKLEAMQDAGLSRIAVSLDGATSIEHDSFRRVVGSFTWTIDIIDIAHDLGLEVQIHTTLCRRTLDLMPRMADLVDDLGAVLWAVFCLVPTGRAGRNDELTAAEYEIMFHWLHERSRTARWNLKLTEGYHYRRIARELAGSSPAGLPGAERSSGVIERAPKPVNAGHGFCFISHTGEICPSGFLPVVAGNVRSDSLVDVYRDHHVFRELRDPSLLKGRCGICEYRALCGGSRSRAFAHTGDYLESDPACAYLSPGEATAGAAARPLCSP